MPTPDTDITTSTPAPAPAKSGIDRVAFFDRCRKLLGKLHQPQIDGMCKILDKWEDSGLTEKRWLAYMLATAWHETGQTMHPVTEWGSAQYLRRKKYWPWIGRGLVQITWKANYLKFGITDPSKALEWPTALDIMFRGMTKGMFTGKRLDQYFNAIRNDPVGARWIINGTDKASKIADYHRRFLTALTGETHQPQPKAQAGTKRSIRKPTTKTKTVSKQKVRTKRRAAR